MRSRASVMAALWIMVMGCAVSTAEITPKSMLENDSLRGPVKSVTTWHYLPEMSSELQSYEIKEYDRAGNVIKSVFFDGEPSETPILEERFTYRDDGAYTTVIKETGEGDIQEIRMRYDADTNEILYTTLNERGDDKPDMIIQLDSNGYDAEIKGSGGNFASQSFNMIFERDEQGNVLSQQIIVNGVVQMFSQYRLNRWGFPDREFSVMGDADIGNDYVAFRYNYDEHHNWIKQYSYQYDGEFNWSLLHPVRIYERLIEYYE